MRKIESNFIGSSESGARLPCTDTHATLPCRATSMTAPGISPSSMCFCVTSSSRFSCAEERPTSSGFDAIGRMPSSACAADAANNSATTLIDFFMAPSSREDLRQLRAARDLPPEGPGPSFTDVSEIEIFDHAPVALGVAHDEAPAARHHLRRHQHLRFRLKLAPRLLDIVDDEDGVHLAPRGCASCGAKTSSARTSRRAVILPMPRRAGARPCWRSFARGAPGAKRSSPRLPPRVETRSAGRCRPRCDERSDTVGIRARHRIVDDHAEVGSTIDGKRRVFQLDRAQDRMPEALGSPAVSVNVIVAPQRFELGAEPAKLVHELADFGNGAGARHIRPERADHETGHAFPIMLRRSDAGVAEDEAKDVALARRERAIVGQHGSGGAIPGDDLPSGGLDQGGTDLERIEQALQTGRDPLGGLVTDLGWTPEPEQEEMFALDVGQHQRSGDPVQHVRRGSAAPSLLQPRVPCRADVGALSDLFPVQPRRPSAPHRETEGARIEPGAAILQVGSQRIVGLDGHADPVEYYTMIISLL